MCSAYFLSAVLYVATALTLQQDSGSALSSGTFKRQENRMSTARKHSSGSRSHPQRQPPPPPTRGASIQKYYMQNTNSGTAPPTRPPPPPVRETESRSSVKANSPFTRMANTSSASPANSSSRLPSDGPFTTQSQAEDQMKMKYMTVDRNYEALKAIARKGMLRVRGVAQ